MSTFIHYSHDGKIYRDKDFDSVGRVGIEITRKNGKSVYQANALTEVKTYKTLRGAEAFMQHRGRSPVAIEEAGHVIFLSSKAEKINKKKK